MCEQRLLGGPALELVLDSPGEQPLAPQPCTTWADKTESCPAPRTIPCHCGMCKAPAESSWPLNPSRGHQATRALVLLKRAQGEAAHQDGSLGTDNRGLQQGHRRDGEQFVLIEPLPLRGPRNGSRWEKAL